MRMAYVEREPFSSMLTLLSRKSRMLLSIIDFTEKLKIVLV